MSYLKDAAEKSREVAPEAGERTGDSSNRDLWGRRKVWAWSRTRREIPPWMLEIRLVREDPDLGFCGLRSYHVKQEKGRLHWDTYPAATSRSYPEVERLDCPAGIRGVTFGDEGCAEVMEPTAGPGTGGCRIVERWILQEVRDIGLLVYCGMR